ncbi:YdgA family protein [Colwellia sp. MB02u-10]|uniref:DUF945 family protein n=1 Tax=Colwellia sp. MB02u-10 TaxID=2759828 RepID=UPI0015F6EC1F|nr:DUF945 family protein [Colwellia sp. MB02u-10]MBA6342844.1 YdgA family protein [Colwellia sp. MB02u-10]
MKKALFAVGALLCVGIIAPKVIGSLVEKKYEDITSRLVEHPSIEITEHSFTSDWFSGQVINKIRFKGVEFDNVDIIVTEQLNFGPLIFSDNEFTLALASSVADVNFEVTNLDESQQQEIAIFTQQLNEKLSISSVVSYGLNYTTHIVLEAIELEQDGNQINSGRIESEFTLSDEKYLEGYINWSGLDFNGSEMNAHVSPLTATFTQEIISGDFYTGNTLAAGDFSMQLSNISAQDSIGNELLNIENLIFIANSEIEQDLMNLHIKYGAERFKGAGQELEKLNLDIALNKLDPQVLIELNDLVMKMQQDPENTESYSQQLTISATKLLANNPELNINDFSLLTPEGTIKSDLQLVVDHTLYDQANPMSIIAALRADAKGVAPLPFFQKMGLEAMINMYVEQGFIMKKEAELSFAAQFAEGQLTVNGQAIAL